MGGLKSTAVVAASSIKFGVIIMGGGGGVPVALYTILLETNVVSRFLLLFFIAFSRGLDVLFFFHRLFLVVDTHSSCYTYCGMAR